MNEFIVYTNNNKNAESTEYRDMVYLFLSRYLAIVVAMLHRDLAIAFECGIAVVRFSVQSLC